MQVEVTSQQTRFGLPTVSLRISSPEVGMSWRTGYVGVPPEHPLYQVDYMDDALIDISVHGGLTFSSDSIGVDNITAQFPNIWWFGFDCIHAQDLPHFDLAFVKAELDNLAHQLREIHHAA